MTDETMALDTDAERKLTESRAEFRRILRPDGNGTDGEFPRSRTMRALTGGGATSALAVVAVAFLVTRPGVASRLARAVPVVNLARRLGRGLR
jgi:hypothetical protein